MFARLICGLPAVVMTVSGLVLGALTATADEPAAVETSEAAAAVSYYREIRPIFQAHCQGCHQPARKMGGYVMTSYETLFKAGDSEEPGIVPGKPDESLVIYQITPADGEPPAMPQERPPLDGEQMALIRRWVAEGAQDDRPPAARTAIDADHPPVYPALPVVSSVDFSPDGSLLAVSGYHEVLLHRADGSGIEARLVGLSARIESAVFSPDGTRLAVTGGSPARFGEVQIWNVADRSLELSHSVTYDTLYGASWTADGTRVAFGCPDNSLRVIDVETGEQVLYQGAHSDWVLDTVFSTDASHLVSVSRDRSMKLTEVATERFVDNITSITPGALKGGLMTVARHPSKDELLIGGADGVPKIYRMYRERARRIGDDFNLIRAFGGLPGRIFAVAFSSDGQQIAVGSSYNSEGHLRVYRTRDAKLLMKIDKGLPPVYTVDFRPDGKVVAAAGFDGMIRLFDAINGETIGQFPAAPLGERIATAAD